MTGPICRWCGAYLDGLGTDEHDEDDCYRQQHLETYRRGAAKARAELAAARDRIRQEADHA